MTLAEIDDSLAGLNPTGLYIASIRENGLAIYATIEGREEASLIVFFAPSDSSPASSGSNLTLLALQDTAFPLIATLLNSSVELNNSDAEPGPAAESTASIVVTPGTATASLGQGPIGKKLEADQDDDEEELEPEPETVSPSVGGKSGWKRVMIGLDEAFEELRRAMQPKPERSNDPGRQDERPPTDCDPPSDTSEAFNRIRKIDRVRTIDAAIDSLSEASGTMPAMPIGGRGAALETAKLQFEPVCLTWCAAQLFTHRKPQHDPAQCDSSRATDRTQASSLAGSISSLTGVTAASGRPGRRAQEPPELEDPARQRGEEEDAQDDQRPAQASSSRQASAAGSLGCQPIRADQAPGAPAGVSPASYFMILRK